MSTTRASRQAPISTAATTGTAGTATPTTSSSTGTSRPTSEGGSTSTSPRIEEWAPSGSNSTARSLPGRVANGPPWLRVLPRGPRRLGARLLGHPRERRGDSDRAATLFRPTDDPTTTRDQADVGL